MGANGPRNASMGFLCLEARATIPAVTAENRVMPSFN